MTSREQFEEWVYQQRVRGINFNINKFDVDGDVYYKSPNTQGQWNAWQASRAAIEIELPNQFPREYYQDRDVIYADELIEELEQSGLKVKK